MDWKVEWFYANWYKTVCARGIHTKKPTSVQIYFNDTSLILLAEVCVRILWGKLVVKLFQNSIIYGRFP